MQKKCGSISLFLLILFVFGFPWKLFFLRILFYKPMQFLKTFKYSKHFYFVYSLFSFYFYCSISTGSKLHWKFTCVKYKLHYAFWFIFVFFFMCRHPVHRVDLWRETCIGFRNCANVPCYYSFYLSIVPQWTWIQLWNRIFLIKRWLL